MSKNWLAILTLGLVPGLAQAEAVPVRGGLNDGFSRLVLEFSLPIAWELGRVPGGYGLRPLREGTEFDLSRAFELLPKRHIASLKQGSDGTLLIGLNCACHADAFAWKDHAVIIDIVEGPAPAEAAFEDNLEQFNDADQARGIAQALAEATNQVAPVTQGADLPDTDLPLLFAEPTQPLLPISDAVPLDAEQPALVAPEPPSQPDIPADMAPAALANLRISGTGNDTRTPSSDETNNDVQSQPAAQPRPNGRLLRLGDGSSSILFGQADALALPDVAVDTSLSAESERVSSARSSLISQLQRAMSQGLLEPPDQELPQTGIQDETETADADEHNPDLRDETLQDRRAHVFVETAADRDALDPVVRALRVNSARNCLPQDWFDVANWHGEYSANPSLDGLRAQLVGEFDKVNTQVAIELAQRYLHLGFGAEARLVLNSFDVDAEQALALMELSRAMDLEFGAHSNAFLRQAICDSPAAIWAIAANPTFRITADLDTKPVLRHFSLLPAHLRNHIGPILAQRFISAGDASTTQAIRDIIDRSTQADQTALDLIDARVELEMDNTRGASPLLETVVAEDGPQAAEALAELIENRFAERLPIDEKLAQSADALAVEYRGTAIGARLVKASIRAFSVAGEPSTTFDRIFDAVENGSISLAEARELRAEAHLGSAEFSSDVDFLRYAFLFPFEDDVLPGVERRARRAVARRLLDHGLPDRALATLPNDRNSWNDTERLIAAGVALAKDRPLEALGYTRGLSDPDATLLTAHALEAAGQLDAAAEHFERVGMAERADALAWRAGNWPRLMETSNATLARAARLGANLPVAALDAQTEFPTQVTSLDLSDDHPLARGREMLQTSQMTREIVEELLALPSVERP